MHLLRRYILIIGTLIVLFLVTGTIVLNHPDTRARLHAAVERAASSSWEGKVVIGEIEASLVPPRIEFDHIRVHRLAEDSEPWIIAQKAAIQLKPWLSLQGHWIIDSLELTGLRGTLDSKDPLFARPSTGPSPLRSLRVDSLQVRSSSLRVLHPEGELRLGRINGWVVPHRGASKIQWEVSQSALTYNQRHYTLHGVIKGSVTGPLVSPRALKLRGTELTFNGAHTRVSGFIYPGHGVHSDLSVEFEGRLAQINTLHPRLAPWLGALSGSLRLQGTLQNPSLQVDLAAAGLSFNGRPLVDLTLDGEYFNKSVIVKKLELSYPGHGSVRVAGAAQLSPPFDTYFNAVLSEASLEHIFAVAGIPGAWVRAPLSGGLTGQVSFAPFLLNANADLNVHGFESLRGSYKNPDSEASLTLKQSQISTDIQITTTEAHLSNGLLKRGSSRLKLHGSLYFDPKKGMNLKLSGDRFRLTDIGKISGVRFNGSGPIGATIEGPYGDPTLSATAELTDFAIGNYDLGTTKATLVYSDKVLDIPRAAIRRGGGKVEGRATLDFRKPPISIAGTFDLKDVPTGPLLDTIVLDTPSSRRFGGLVSGRVIFEGPLTNPRGVLRLQSPGLLIDNSNLGPARALTEFGQKDKPLSINLNVKPGTGAISIYYALLPHQQMVLKSSVDTVPLPVLTPVLGNVALGGSLSGSAELSGPTNALNGAITLEATPFRAFGVALEKTQLHGAVEKGTVTLSGTALNGDAALTGQLLFQSGVPYSLTLKFADLALNRTGMIPQGIDPRATGSLFSQGKLLQAKTIMADADLQTLDLHVANAVLHQQAPIRIHYNHDGFDFQDVRLTGDDMSFMVNGKASLTRSLEMGVYANGPLSGTNGVWSGLEFTRGLFDLNLKIQGSWNVPTYHGYLAIEDGAVQVSQMRVTDIATQIAFEGDTITLPAGSATIGDGVTQFEGNILLIPKEPAQVNISAAMKQLRLTPLRDLEMTVTGNLNLLGKSDDLELRGDLELESLRYIANLDLQQLLRTRDTPLRVPTAEPGRGWRLHINVDADDNLLVANNVLEAEFKSNLRITGTTDHVGAIGTVTPLWAKASYAGNSYNVERAILDFTDEYRIFSQFDVLAATEACGMELQVALTGNSDRYIVEATGKDENGPVDSQDALLCAQFGVRLQNYARDDSSGLRDTLPGAVDALWKVSGMDEQVRRFFPVVDELRLTSGYSKSSARVEPRVLLSKELGQDWELNYNGPLYYKDEQHVISLEYRLNSHATLESTWVSVSEASIGDLGLDLRLQWEFE